MKPVQSFLLLLVMLCPGELILASEPLPYSILLRIGSAQNNRVSRVVVMEGDSTSGILTSVRTYRSCYNANVSLDQLETKCSVTRSVSVSKWDENELVYEITDGSQTGTIKFSYLGNAVQVASDYFEGPRNIIISRDRASYVIADAGKPTFVLDTDSSGFVVTTLSGTTEFSYDAGQRYKVSRLMGSATSLEARVTASTDGRFVVEMPSYGDPGEFSHRIEVWTDEPSRGTLRSAAINSYLLPAGTFDFIFPFFAPTPQEVLEQAAAAQ